MIELYILYGQYNYGAEFVRINIEGHLRQKQKDGKTYLGKLSPMYFSKGDADGHYEKSQIQHSFKWSPIKVFENNFKGIGSSSDWRLEVEYLARDGESIPQEGIPFTAILTVSDPKKEQPVFVDMHQKLQSMGLKIFDIKVAARNAIRT